MGVLGRTTAAQRPGFPLFGPSPPLAGMPDSLIEATALYAGETALRIGEIVSSADAVALLADATIPSS